MVRYIRKAARIMAAFALLASTNASPAYAEDKSIGEIIRDTAPRTGAYLTFYGDIYGDGIPDIVYQGNDGKKMVFYREVDGATGKIIREGQYNDAVLIRGMAPVKEQHLVPMITELYRHTRNERVIAPGNNNSVYWLLGEFDQTGDGIGDPVIQQTDRTEWKGTTMTFSGKDKRKILHYPLEPVDYVVYWLGQKLFAMDFITVVKQENGVCEFYYVREYLAYDPKEGELVVSKRDNAERGSAYCDKETH